MELRVDNEQLLEFQIQRSVEGNGSAEVKRDTCAVLTRSPAYHILTYARIAPRGLLRVPDLVHRPSAA